MSAIAARRARLAAAVDGEEVKSSQPVSSAEVSDGSNDVGPMLGSLTTDGHDFIALSHKRERHKEEVDNRRRRRKREPDPSHTPHDSSDAEGAEAFRKAFKPRLSGKLRNTSVELDADAEHEASVICAFQAGESAALIGCGTVEVLCGVGEINGAHLSPEHQPSYIFAPSSSPLPLLSVPDNAHSVGPDVLQQYGLESRDFAAVFRLREVRDSGLQDIGDICPLLNPDAFTSGSSSASLDWPLQGFGSVVHPSKYQEFRFNSSWRDALLEVEEHFASASRPICLIRGSKRVGKSTFSRSALQRLITSSVFESDAVAYLETDLGQSEFGLPETVALHVFDSARLKHKSSSPITFAPSWASYRHADACRFLGEVSPKNDPDEYIRALCDLFTIYRTRWQTKGVPLIINTQGWVKGLGANLLEQLQELLLPTLVVEIVEDATVPNVLPQHSSSKTVIIETSTSLQGRERGANATEARELNITSYFYMTNIPCSNAIRRQVVGANQDGGSSLPRWHFQIPLLAHTPFLLDISVALPGGLHVANSTAHIDTRLRLLSLNGSCAALVFTECRETTNGAPEAGEGRDKKWLSVLQKPPPPRSTSAFVSYAIVRSIDVEDGKLHLLCPLNTFTLALAQHSSAAADGGQAAQGLALVKGCTSGPPVWLSLDAATLQACQRGGTDGTGTTHVAGVPLHAVPYLDFNQGRDDTPVSMSKRRTRRNLLRPSQRRAADV